MRTIFLETNNFLASVQSSAEGYYSQIKSRVNLPIPRYKITFVRLRVSYVDGFRASTNMEAIVIPEYSLGNVINPQYCFKPKDIQSMFAYDKALKFISGLINLELCSKTDIAFNHCSELRTVKLFSLKLNLDISYSPKLTSKSILYMIENEAATSAISITLHADAYARAMANADIVAALEAHPNVSLASA